MIHIVAREQVVSFSFEDSNFNIAHDIEGIIFNTKIYPTRENILSAKRGVFGLIKNITEDMPLIFKTKILTIDFHDSKDSEVKEFLQVIKEFISQ